MLLQNRGQQTMLFLLVVLCIVFGCFSATVTELSGCTETVWHAKFKLFAFYRKFADPCSRMRYAPLPAPNPIKKGE